MGRMHSEMASSEDKLWRLLMDCRRSPFSTSSCRLARFNVTFSFRQIYSSFSNCTSAGMALKRNFMHLEASGSMILVM